MTSDELKLKRLAEAATPGPWINPGKVVRCQASVQHLDQTFVIDRVIAQTSIHDKRSDDMAFIAAANPAVILSLLARIEALEQDAARYRWLRNQAPETIDDLGRLKTVDEFDAAIDALIAQQDKGKETV